MVKVSAPLYFRAQTALGVSQQKLAEIAGTSYRTVQRWSAGSSSPFAHNLHDLARAVYPVDPGLAAELAIEGKTSLEALGLVVREAPPPAPPPPEPPPPLDAEHLADSIVCAAAQSSGLAPRIIRPILLAAFARARGLRMDVATAERGLRAGKDNDTGA
jgi:transcriptional regulator with XRE-family HTH domain